MTQLMCRVSFRPRGFIVRCFNKIVMTDDGSTIVALHRDEEFPYEHSRPLPDEIKKDDSVLKMTDYQEVKRVFKSLPAEMARKQLASLTLTTEHKWFPRARDKKAKKNEMNRPYL
ncbi:39S ribosomal protein L42, mitochondrial [Hyposmocoma kahamanoa]|uniref:39S ribosomal protein L42, mitochondrial n=1 Tax=Hyposmocoma kahamanoa TaxID=1477025 RepID=UPI000E6D7326|nr:39S ribosomal protein L42, mitochondrial [Hyposmocoma kahamanoa]